MTTARYCSVRNADALENGAPTVGTFNIGQLDLGKLNLGSCSASVHYPRPRSSALMQPAFFLPLVSSMVAESLAARRAVSTAGRGIQAMAPPFIH
jgi:hypothetical protein